MWISTLKFVELVEARAKAVGIATALERANDSLKLSNDWFKLRLTQVETERAQLVHRLTGVTIPVPEFAPREVEQPQSDMQSFMDMGDALAAEQGIGWNPDGSVNYKN